MRKLTSFVCLSGIVAMAGGTLTAQEAELRHSLDMKVKGAVRNSEEYSFSTTFPPGSELRTVEPGTHTDIATIELKGSLQYGSLLTSRIKVDVIDQFDRNPTSTDKEVDVDELWIRLGKESQPWMLPDGPQVYAKIGKFAKFERQNDRHLESYGLLSTAFNRFEDNGLEAGADLGPNFYVKASYTAGNPLYLRDPNALAGDNGTPGSLNGSSEHNSGIPMLYDAEVEDGDFETEYAELGGGIGARWASEDRSLVVNGLVFAYQREMQDEVDMHGSIYGGDLDILSAPSIDGEAGTEPTWVWGREGNDKEEYGANLWVYWNAVTLFGQYVDQEAAGLGRKGFEFEASYRFDLPAVLTLGDQQVFQSIAPAVRYSEIEHDFAGPKSYPAPSIWWDWRKTDIGFRMQVIDDLSLTAEYAINEFEVRGRMEDNNEFLATLVWTSDL